MTRDGLIAVAKWKWKGGRTRQLCGQNSEPDGAAIALGVSRAERSGQALIGAVGGFALTAAVMALVILAGLQLPLTVGPA